MTKVIVIGAGIAGLSSALAMQAKGFEVDVLERDPAPPEHFDPTEVSAWRRRGAPQVPHPHFLMGGLRNLIYAHHPKLVDALLEAGVWELPFRTRCIRSRARTTGRGPATRSSPRSSAVAPPSKP